MLHRSSHQSLLGCVGSAFLLVLVGFPAAPASAQVPSVGSGRCVANCGTPSRPSTPSFRGSPSYSDDDDDGPAPRRVDPRRAEATRLNNQATAYSGEAALALYRKAQQLNPNSITIRANIAHTEGAIAAKRGDYRLALAKYKLAYAIKPTEVRARNIAALPAMIAGAEKIAARKRGDYDLAVAKAREAYRLKPSEARRASISHQESYLFESKGDYARALAKMREANSILASSPREQAIRDLESKLASQQSGSQRQAGTGNPFNIPSNPANVQLKGTTPGTPLTGQTSIQQAGSAAAHGRAARDTASDDTAREHAGRSFDTNPTIPGTAVDLRISSQRGHPVVPPEIRQKYPQIADLEKKREVLERDVAPLEEQFKELQKRDTPRGADWGEKYDKVSKQIAEKHGEINYLNSQIKKFVLD